jgi:hypothetical protein
VEERVSDVVESRQRLDVLDWVVAGAEAAGCTLPPEHAQPRAGDVVRARGCGEKTHEDEREEPDSQRRAVSPKWDESASEQ